ncbi:MAG: DNA-binding protein [Deltaproteobacteria bacterium]|nr:DNA-binding protein [Deltaproteobacteria bacterium]
MGGVKSKAISSDKLHIENKTIFVDLKENEGGKFLQIAELSNNRRSTVVIPWSGLPVFLEAVQKACRSYNETV